MTQRLEVMEIIEAEAERYQPNILWGVLSSSSNLSLDFSSVLNAVYPERLSRKFSASIKRGGSALPR